MVELHDALNFITMLFFIQKILTFNLGVAFLKSVRHLTGKFNHILEIQHNI